MPKLVKKGNITPRSAAALAAAAAAAGSHDNEDEEDIGSQGSTWRARSPSRPRTKASTTTNEVPAASQDQLTPPREQLPMSPSGLAQRAFNLVADLTTGDTGATTPRNNNNKRSSKDHNVVGDNAAMSSSARAKMRWKDGANKLKVMGALGKTPTALQPGIRLNNERGKGKERIKTKANYQTYVISVSIFEYNCVCAYSHARVFVCVMYASQREKALQSQARSGHVRKQSTCQYHKSRRW